jgi:hypothetical protein
MPANGRWDLTRRLKGSIMMKKQYYIKNSFFKQRMQAVENEVLQWHA